MRSHKTVESWIFYYFCLMMEGSGFESLTNGSGSGTLLQGLVIGFVDQIEASQLFGHCLRNEKICQN
jgi:hypothetical protein